MAGLEMGTFNTPARFKSPKVKQLLQQDPFFTIKQHIELDSDDFIKLKQENETLAKDPPKQKKDVEDWIYVLWILSDLFPDSGIYASQAFKLSKDLNNFKLIKPSACRMILMSAFEVISKNELMEEIFLKAEPGNFKENILLCSEALVLITTKTNVYLEKATKFSFYSSLFDSKYWATLMKYTLVHSKSDFTFNQVIDELLNQTKYGLYIDQFAEKYLMIANDCIKRENHIFIPEEKKQQISEMIKTLKSVETLQSKCNPSIEIEELIVNGCMDEKKLFSIMASKPSIEDCLRLFYALPGLELTNSKENDEWGSVMEIDNTWKHGLSHYYVSSIHKKINVSVQRLNLGDNAVSQTIDETSIRESELEMYGSAVTNLVIDYLKSNEVVFAVALLEACVDSELFFIKTVYESDERKATVLYQCEKYIEWCMELTHDDGWLTKLQEISMMRQEYETEYCWSDNHSTIIPI